MKPLPPPEDKPRRKDKRKPWNNVHTKLEIYISPELKMRLGLPHKTTEEALKKRKEEQS